MDNYIYSATNFQDTTIIDRQLKRVYSKKCISTHVFDHGTIIFLLQPVFKIEDLSDVHK